MSYDSKKVLFVVIIIFVIIIIDISRNGLQWTDKGAGSFSIQKQESYNYSEIISGDLDSTEKKELENYKKKQQDGLVDNKQKSSSIVTTMQKYFGNLWKRTTRKISSFFDN